MKKINILLILISLGIYSSCVTVKPKIHKDEPTENFGYPHDKTLEKSFFLVGDGGYSPTGGTSEGLIAFKNFIDSVEVEGNYTIFLGDNIYPVGMPPEDSPRREFAEYRLDAQIDALEDYQGNVVVIPGNHDWYDEGIAGLERQRDYTLEKVPENLIWSPDTGCGLDIIEITDDIQLIVIDSQWYLENWDRHPTINRDCELIKSREAMLLEVETELKKSQNKTVIIAMHHPILSNGIHGGQYNFNRHIYPTQKKIPIPLLGSLAMLIRTTGGVSIQDLQNERYQSLARRLETIAHRRERVIFVAGHEHSLQYIDNENVKQIISGSASKGTFSTLSNDGRFAYSGQGFAVYDVFEDGSSWVSFYGNRDNKAKVLFQKEVFPAKEEYNLEQYASEFPETIKASVYSDEETDISGLHRTVWGERYRELYGREIELKVADLDTLYGGLEPLIKSGGHQTVSVRMKDSLNREYNMRRIRKESVQYLQKVAFKDTPIQDDMENTVAERLMTDFYTAAHPYAFLAVPGLASAANVHHTNPELFYMPKQPILGRYNEEHGDDIYMIVERPEENWLGAESFGRPNHDIVSTTDMFDRLRRDEKYSLDEARYIRSRIFDMLIGDWDRHQDQWRWAEIEDQEGNRVFEAIPRDRDQVFSNFDGAFFGTLRALAGFANQFAVYDEDIKDIEWFNIAAVGLDRSLLQNTGRETWLEEAKFIQENMTDEAIEKAFEKLPKETSGEVLDDLVNKLKGRRDNIVDIATRYYEHMAKLAIVTGTDKDDFIDITRMKDGKTRVKITRNKGGERAETLSDKIYSREETKDIWVYALDDDDEILVEGEGDNEIFIRVIGGLGNDIYTIKNGKRLKIYDHKSLPNTVVEEGGARFRFRDHYDINTYDKDKKNFRGGAFLPGIGFNPDDGFKIALENVLTINDFKRNPFTSQHRFGGGYYFATNGFDLYYEGQFANIIGRYNLLVGASYQSPNFASNFFGFGNETENFEDELGMDYNRVKISRYKAKAGFVNKTPFGSYFRYMANYEINKVENTEGRFINEEFTPEDPNFFDRKYFAGLDALYRYESYDNSLNPTRGMKFEVNLGGQMNTADTEQHYGYFKHHWSFYNSLVRSRKLVLKSQVNAHLNMGTGYEFYQAARLGADTGLRGYRIHRFIGKSAFAAGGDLRYSFDEFKTGFLPLQMGVFGGYDIGRVWNDFEESNKWHDSFGGGIWITSARAVNGTLSLFKGSESWRFAFGFGLKF